MFFGAAVQMNFLLARYFAASEKVVVIVIFVGILPKMLKGGGLPFHS